MRVYTIKPLVWVEAGPGQPNPTHQKARVPDGEYEVWDRGWQFDQDDHYGMESGEVASMEYAKRAAESHHRARVEEYLNDTGLSISS